MMTKKQYTRKVMRLQRDMEAYFIKTNGKSSGAKTDRVSVPKFGTVITFGKYKGQKLVSYEQCYDMLMELIEGIEALIEALK